MVTTFLPNRYNCKSMEMFSDAQGHLTPQSEVASGGNLISKFKLLWLSSLHARMKKIQFKMKALNSLV